MFFCINGDSENVTIFLHAHSDYFHYHDSHFLRAMSVSFEQATRKEWGKPNGGKISCSYNTAGTLASGSDSQVITGRSQDDIVKD